MKENKNKYTNTKNTKTVKKKIIVKLQKCEYKKNL